MEGRTLGHYKILNLLGLGGMGEVYLAEDTRLHRRVALKLLPEEIAKTPERRARFEREARAAAALSHPGIVTIHSIEEADGIRFITMELVDGEALSRAIPPKGMTLGRFLEIAIPLVEAVAAAHDAGITHRDLKPDNVMLASGGRVKILDFGLAKVGDPSRDVSRSELPTGTSENLLTMDGKVLGTAAYMSPEQAEGLVVDSRSDIFSLGAVFYEMATGRRPFVGATSAALISSILRDNPTPITELNPSLPNELWRIVRHCLAKDRTRRYQSAHDLRNDLLDVRDDLRTGEIAVPGRHVASLLRRTRMKPGTLAFVALAVVALAASTAILVTQLTGRADVASESRGPDLAGALPGEVAGDPAVPIGATGATGATGAASPSPGAPESAPTGAGSPQPPPSSVSASEPPSLPSTSAPLPTRAKLMRLTEFPGEEIFPSLSPDGKSLVYASSVSDDIHLLRVGGANPMNLTGDYAGRDTQPVFSPDGERIAFRSDRNGGGVFVMGATGEDVRRVSDMGYNPAWSPDGKSIALAAEDVTTPYERHSPSRIFIVDVATGARREITSQDSVQPSFSPRGTRIAFWGREEGTGQRDIWTQAVGGGKAVRVTSEDSIDWNPTWSPDGRMLYFCSNRGGAMNLWRVAIDERTGAVRGKAEAVTAGAGAEVMHPRLSADGKEVVHVVEVATSHVEMLELDPGVGKVTTAPVAVVSGSVETVGVDVSPDGAWLAYATVAPAADVHVVRVDGTGRRQVTDDPGTDRPPRWSPDGARLAFASNRTGPEEIWIANVDGTGSRQLTATGGESAVSPVWSPDGRQVAYFNRTRKQARLRTVAPSPGEAPEVTLASVPATGTGLVPSDWSPDGRRLAGEVGSGNRTGVVVYDFETGEFSEPLVPGRSPRWLDDKRIVYVSGTSLLVTDVKRGKTTGLLALDSGPRIAGYDVAPDGRALYVARSRNEADVWVMSLQ